MFATPRGMTRLMVRLVFGSVERGISMDVSKRLHVVGSLVMILVCSSMVFAPPKSGSGSEELVSPSGAEAHNMVRAGATLDTGRCFYASRSVMIRHDDIYEKPYWFSKKVGCLSACQGFDIVGKSSDSQWYKLSGGGWVSFVYIYRKPYVPIVATPKHNYNQKFSTAVPFVCTSTTGAGVQATAVPMVLISPTKFPVPPEVAPSTSSGGDAGGLVKMSRRNICHAPGTRWYNETVNFTSYNSVDDCLAAGGRLPRNP